MLRWRDTEQTPNGFSWAADDHILFGTPEGIHRVPASSGARKFLGGPGRKRSGRFSPDGKWMAFVSDETGDYEVYVSAYRGPGPTVAVSTKGDCHRSGRQTAARCFSARAAKSAPPPKSSAAPLGFSAPVELFNGPDTLDLKGHQREDVARDGRFLMVENSDDFPIVVVQDWAAELARGAVNASL